MRRTLNLYLRLISIQLRSQMQFRIPFWIDTITTGLLNVSYFFSTFLVLERFGNIAGWQIAELAFLYGMIETSFGMMDMIFSGFDPDRFSITVRLGTLDQVLLRPIKVEAQIMGSTFILRRVGRIAQGAAVLIYALSNLNIHWTAGKLAYLPLVFASQVLAMGALFIVGSTMVFWTVQRVEAINVLTYGGTEVMSYPSSIYPRWLRGFFTYIIPFVFLNYYPALYFLDKPDPLGLPIFAPFLAVPAAGLLFFIAMRFWKFGLAHYQSTGT
jgi:ABC-2 type transport system permease protein